MRANSFCCIAIATLGFLAAVGGLSASLMPMVVPSLVATTIFALLAIAIVALAIFSLTGNRPAETTDWVNSDETSAKLQQEIETLKQFHLQLLEDKAFLQFLKSDQDRERQLLALDLHDLTLPNLTSALFQLETLSQRADVSSETLEAAVELIRESLLQARRVMNCLSPSLVQDEGVIASLQRLADQLSTSVATVEFQHDVDFDRLTPLSECALVQLVREAFDTIRRNRSAAHVHLDLRQNDDRLSLLISDDGRSDPFQEAEAASQQRIRECVELLAGHLEIECPRDGGTITRIDFSVTDLTQSDTLSEKSQAIS